MKGPQSKESACWYDNELGYTHTLVEHAIKAGNA